MFDSVSADVANGNCSQFGSSVNLLDLAPFRFSGELSQENRSAILDQSRGLDKVAARLVFAGDVSGGLAVSIKNFWQSYPAGLEVRHASAGTGRARADEPRRAEAGRSQPITYHP